MSLMRWNPMSDFVSLRDAMERLMSDSFVQPFGARGSGFSNLLSEMYEDDNEYVVKVVMPGIKPEDVELTVTGDVLNVHGRSGEEKPQEDGNKRYHVRSSGYREFSQSVSLPGPVMSDKATADCENGIITVHLPKAEEARAKRIQVQVKGQSRLIEGQTNQK